MPKQALGYGLVLLQMGLGTKPPMTKPYRSRALGLLDKQSIPPVG